MRKVSYEAWAAIGDDGKLRRGHKSKLVRLYENKTEAKLYARLVQKVRVTIEPVKAAKKRKATR